ncbi:MAG: Stp1/IreP family PP2C-type Ser/Thr phosphatase [Burkholderiales bacterium]
MTLHKALEIVSATHVGRLRDHNEDSIGIDGDRGVAILADGMGGYNAGEVASGIAVAMLMTELEAALSRETPHLIRVGDSEPTGVALLRDTIDRANLSILQAARGQPQYAGMGTTLVTALFHDDRVAVAHIGDSRLYRLRGDVFEQITRDHSLLQEQIDSGMLSREQARRSQNKNLVTRALGIDRGVEAEIHVHDVLPQDVYLICSDGLSDMVPDEDLHLALSSLRERLQLAADHLVRMANDNGGRDNISVILVRVLHSYPASVGFFAKIKSWIK